MNRILFGAATCVLLISCDVFAQGGGGRRRGMNVARMLERFDSNKDGKLTKEEVGAGRMWDRIARADKDGDDIVTKKEMESMGGGGGGGRGRSGEATWKFLQEKYDANKDKAISAEEYTRDQATFTRLDKDKDGALTEKDFASTGERQRGGRDRGEGGGRARGSAPEAGDVAPNFTLTFVGDGKKTIKLSDYKGDKPVALVFGSCT